MPQYRDGVVSLYNGSNVVRACWKSGIVGNAVNPFTVNCALQFIGAGSPTGLMRSHDLASKILIWEPDPLSADVAEGATFRGASNVNPDGGTCKTGSTVASLRDDTKSWSVDEYNGDWVILRPGQVTEEWRRINDTLTGPCRLIPETNFNVLGIGDPYGVYTNQEETLAGFFRGTPQDFVAATSVGDYFCTPDLGVLFQVIARTAGELTLAANWPNADIYAQTFSITRDFTPRGFPILHPQDVQANTIVGRLAAMADAAWDVTWLTLASATVAGYENSWADDTPGAEVASFCLDSAGFVRFRGAVANPGSPTPPSVICRMTSAYYPVAPLRVVVPGTSGSDTILEISTGGNVNWLGGESDEVYLNPICYYAGI
jgi:hypothetical protein